jgi:glycosyltransferase involved in cell wall biosynthesis
VTIIDQALSEVRFSEREARPRICFVGLDTYSLFNVATRFRFGGAEVRSYLFSTALARSNRYDVCYVVQNHGQPSPETFEGVRVVAHCGYPAPTDHPLILRLHDSIQRAGGVIERTPRFPYRRICNYSPKLLTQYSLLFSYAILAKIARRLWKRKPGLSVGRYTIAHERLRTYEEVDADIYCVFGVTTLAAEVAAYCRSREKRFVLFIADVTNLDKRYQPDAIGANVYGDLFYLCRYAIDNADLIVTQVESQARELLERFERRSVTIRNPINLCQLLPAPPYPQRRIALWIGRADNFKKMPAILLELAARFQQITFVMVMNMDRPEVAREIHRNRPNNVTIIEDMPYREVETLFAQAFVFVSTSLTEGFPNTFLQAGKYGVPILSYAVDPDGFIERYRCGWVAHGDVEALVAGMEQILIDQARGGEMSENIRLYVSAFHELENRRADLEAALEALVSDEVTAASVS